MRIDCQGVTLVTAGGRVLVKDLRMSLGRERVALVGRNGVGKTTLLETLAGLRKPDQGQVVATARPYLVSQLPGLGGEARREHLGRARAANPEMLLLDEPTQDLDAEGVAWLRDWLAGFSGGLVVASHDPLLLRDFEHFFVLSESGGRYFQGTLEELEASLEREQGVLQAAYLSRLHRMVEQAEHIDHVARRRARKKRYGRVRELDRATPRAILNQKRDAAQDNHGRDRRVRQARLDSVRQWALAGRRALRVELPLVLPERGGEQGIRWGVVGANGSGKTTFLSQILASSDPARTGSIAQGGVDWMREESLLSLVGNAEVLLAQRFPLALARRPLRSLSPGERVRAALICLFQNCPEMDLLVLDEPTCGLDLVGRRALREGLRAWKGGLVVASHDRDFLLQIGVSEWVKC